MDLRVHEVLFQFNQGMDQALESLNVVEKLELTTQKPATSSLPAHLERPAS